MNPAIHAHPNDVDQLNSFLRGEISAVETYDQALEKVDGADARRLLADCRASHHRRCDVLATQIQAAGGEPADGSGAWGAFAKAVEGGAKLFGDSAAVAALAQGEEHGLNDYRSDLSNLTTAARQLVQKELLPEQESTTRAVEELKRLV